MRNLQFKRVLLKNTYSNPKMYQNIFSALLIKCRLDPLGMCSLFWVQPISLDITKSLSFQVHSSVSVSHCWLGVSHLSSKDTSAISPAIWVVSKSVVQMFPCFLSLSAIAGNVGVCVKWGLSGGNNFRIPRGDGWLSCTTSVFSSKCMTPSHYLI